MGIGASRRKYPKYKTGKKEAKKTILILCEGQTEKIYFDSFEVLSMNIDIVNLKGESIGRWERYIQEKQKSDAYKYDIIWCVFDRGYSDKDKDNEFDTIIKKLTEKKYKVAYSNDSFELWFLLHYQDIPIEAGPMYRKYCIKQLEKRIQYDKSEKYCRGIYDRILSFQQKAIDKAKKLYNDKKEQPYHKQNPVTTVYQLVEFLNENKKI